MTQLKARSTIGTRRFALLAAATATVAVAIFFSTPRPARSADSWAPVSELSMARWSLAATTGPDRRIYAIGGYPTYTTPDPSNTAEVYSPRPNGGGSWATIAAPMSTPRYGLAAATGSDLNPRVVHAG